MSKYICTYIYSIIFQYINFLRFYLFIHGRHRKREREAETQAEREKQAPCREPDVGLHPETPGPRPGPKAGTKLLSHPRIPNILSFKIIFQGSFLNINLSQ